MDSSGRRSAGTGGRTAGEQHLSSAGDHRRISSAKRGAPSSRMSSADDRGRRKKGAGRADILCRRQRHAGSENVRQTAGRANGGAVSGCESLVPLCQRGTSRHFRRVESFHSQRRENRPHRFQRRGKIHHDEDAGGFAAAVGGDGDVRRNRLKKCKAGGIVPADFPRISESGRNVHQRFHLQRHRLCHAGKRGGGLAEENGGTVGTFPVVRAFGQRRATAVRRADAPGQPRHRRCLKSGHPSSG